MKQLDEQEKTVTANIEQYDKAIVSLKSICSYSMLIYKVLQPCASRVILNRNCPFFFVQRNQTQASASIPSAA